jgi:hypothetical protein
MSIALTPIQEQLLTKLVSTGQYDNTALVQAGETVLTGSTIEDLLQFAGTWHGDDFEKCLQGVYDTRLPAEF